MRVQGAREQIARWQSLGREDLALAAYRKNPSWLQDAELALLRSNLLLRLGRLAEARTALREAKSLPKIGDAQVAWADKRLEWIDDELGKVDVAIGRARIAIGVAGLAVVGMAGAMLFWHQRRQRVEAHESRRSGSA